MTSFYLLNFPCLLPGAVKGDLGRDWHGRTVYGPILDHRLKRQGMWLDYIYILGSHFRICGICCSANQAPNLHETFNMVPFSHYNANQTLFLTINNFVL